MVRMSPETFERYYDGPVLRIGKMKRVRVSDLESWLDRVNGADQKPSGWAKLGGDRQSQRRKAG